MRGSDVLTESQFSYVSCEARVPAMHPLRPIRAIADEVIEVLSTELGGLYSEVWRSVISPEKLLRALLLQAFYSIRSEHQLMEQVGYNMLFRWFVGLSMDAPVWNVDVFIRDRDRLLKGDIASKILTAVMVRARSRALLSNEHFSLDDTLIEAWAWRKAEYPLAITSQDFGTDTDTQDIAQTDLLNDFADVSELNLSISHEEIAMLKAEMAIQEADRALFEREMAPVETNTKDYEETELLSEASVAFSESGFLTHCSGTVDTFSWIKDASSSAELFFLRFRGSRDNITFRVDIGSAAAFNYKQIFLTIPGDTVRFLLDLDGKLLAFENRAFSVINGDVYRASNNRVYIPNSLR